ncbi:MAG: hypothetical protein KAS96_09820 [Planctomycetes bacterium]|nr:hypothetical protein [Planctomycetota bacterium]
MFLVSVGRLDGKYWVLGELYIEERSLARLGNVGMLMDYESGEKDGFQNGLGVVLV